MSTQSPKLPSFNLLKSSFLGAKYDAPSAAAVIGGRVRSNFLSPGQPEYENTCALRVSRALNYAGARIKSVAGVRMNLGGEKFWYIYSVDDLEKYLRHRYGAPNIDKKGSANGDVTEADFKNEQGIILFKSYHTDLWNGTGCEGHCYFNQVKEVMLWHAP